jgi:2-polyprenyl-3-methyl-5-hydroxy-6-metoxy-1,4-benzoquinol methylase
MHDSTVFEPCNLCQQTAYRVVFQSRSHTEGDPKASSFSATADIYGDFGQVVRCQCCDLIYTSPRLVEATLLKLYQQQDDENYAVEDVSRSINAFFCLNTILQFKQAGDLLEIGCAAGYFLNAARLHFKVQGIEPRVGAATFARKQLNLPVMACRLIEARFPDASFDVVVMLDVIEHLTDPISELREIHRVLRPNGLIYIVTPNIASLTARCLRSKWWGLRAAHLYYFTPATLTAMLQRTGFEVAQWKPYGRVFRMNYWISRLKNYASWLTRSVEWTMKRLGIANKLVYINTMDSMEFCALKKL